MPVSDRTTLSYAESSRIVLLSSSDRTSVVEPPTFPRTTLIVIPTAPTLPHGVNLITKSRAASPTVPTLTETTCWYVPPPFAVISYLSNILLTFTLQARPTTLSRNSMPPPPPLHIPSLQYSTNSQQQQQQQQSRALFPQQNGSLTYPVTSPTSSSSSPSYSVRLRSSPSTNLLTHTCDDLISHIICHRLSLDLRAANRTTTLFRPLTSITLRSRSRTTATWSVPLLGLLSACDVLISRAAYSHHFAGPSISVHPERAGTCWWQSVARISL